ncbi:twin-arginine translocation signal domain-containing protein [Streptomyces sp. CB01201]|uniref:twin-arginine translocation signal domain-containing protein n=1 Tax=Streptomyces sp. CB01201 TaxID=2020324 RepID=UPI001F1AE913|nr:twin-arginine translocation signal domain-containing protein [Streptomyces sp. CB01201]
MTRRTVVQACAVIGGAAAIGSMLPATAAVAGERRGPRRPATSANGWTTQPNADLDSQVWTRPVAGVGLDVQVWIGDVEAVLVHIVRRFHYEVQELAAVDLAGWRPAKALRRGLPESNLASGTAVRIRQGAGAKGSLFPLQVAAVRDLLADCQGIVRWGGDDKPVDESLFYIAVGPHDERLPRLATAIREATFR